MFYQLANTPTKRPTCRNIAPKRLARAERCINTTSECRPSQASAVPRLRRNDLLSEKPTSRIPRRFTSCTRPCSQNANRSCVRCWPRPGSKLLSRRSNRCTPTPAGKRRPQTGGRGVEADCAMSKFATRSLIISTSQVCDAGELPIKPKPWRKLTPSFSERLRLLVHILRHIAEPAAKQPASIRSQRLNIQKLQDATTESMTLFFASNNSNLRKRSYLDDIFMISRQEERFRHGEISEQRR